MASRRRPLLALSALAVCGAVTATALSWSPSASPPLATGDEPVAAPTTTPAPSPAPPSDRATTAPTPAGPPPNIVVITADDMAVGDLAHMPRTRRLLVEQGTTFTEAIAPTPICVPARASILTGQYAHNHGALTIYGEGGGIDSFRDTDTLPVWLRRAGYSTLFTGKYLNGYGVEDPSYVPPGWSSWRASIDPTTYSYTTTQFSVDGTVTQPDGYVTDLVSGFSRDLIEQHRADHPDRPFFLWANYVAPHIGGPPEPDDPSVRFAHDPGANIKTAYPAPQHRDSFAGVDLPDVPSMLRDTVGNAYGTHVPATADRRAGVREAYQQRLESLQSVDDAVAETIRTLREQRVLARTLVILTSDHGYLVGEHNRVSKLVPYDESLRMPVVVRGPGVPRGEEASVPATNPDLAVSIAAAARATPGRRVDGIDVLGLLGTEHADARRVVPIEAYPIRGGRRPLYTGIRYGPWTYVRNRNGSEELYDRTVDPYELRNRKGAHPRMLRALRRLDVTYRQCAGNECPKELDPVV